MCVIKHGGYNTSTVPISTKLEVRGDTFVLVDKISLLKKSEFQKEISKLFFYFYVQGTLLTHQQCIKTYCS